MCEDENERTLIEGLRAVAGAAPQEAPPRVGFKLRAAFREHHSRRRQRRILWTVAAVAWAAMFLGVGVALRMRSSILGLKQSPRQANVSTPSPATKQARGFAPRDPLPPAAHVARKGRAAFGTQSAERMTEFFLLPYSDGSLPLDNAVIIRVTLPRAALGLAGLPVSEEGHGEIVQADLVLGEDGLARAVRFVL